MQSTWYFNSRSREKVDACCWRISSDAKIISTHDLARRSTLAIVRDEQVCYYFNSRPHEKVDITRPEVFFNNFYFNSQGGRFTAPFWARLSVRYFNSRPREEVDWLFPVCFLPGIHFNSRPRKEVDAVAMVIEKAEKTFQLTTSQGGRQPMTLELLGCMDYFNSRPRKEVDFLGGKLSTPSVPFQLTTSQGGRLFSCE